MAPVLARCDNCDLVFNSRFFPDSSFMRGAAIGNSESCPRCGGRAQIQDIIGGEVIGWRDVAERFTSTAQSATVTDLQTFQDIARAAASGEISQERAEEWARNLSSGFGDILTWVNRNSGALSLLLAIVAIIISLRSNRDDDIKHDEMMDALERSRPAAERVVPDYEAPPFDPRVVKVPSSPYHQPMTPDQLRAWWNSAKKT